MTNQTNKTQPTNVSVKDFLSGIKDNQQRKDAQKLCKLMSQITGKQPVMWGSSIIGFDQYHYKYASGREGDIGALGFSPRKSNLTIYLIDGMSGHRELLQKLGPHTTGKACLYIKRLDDVDMSVLKKLLTDSYKKLASHSFS